MICKNCGNPLPDEAKFCSKCGCPVAIEQKAVLSDVSINGAHIVSEGDMLDSILGRNEKEEAFQFHEKELSSDKTEVFPTGKSASTESFSGQESSAVLPVKNSKAKNYLKIALISLIALVLIAVGIIYGIPFIKYNASYKAGVGYFEQKQYAQARNTLAPVAEADYRDSKEIIVYMNADDCYNAHDFFAAYDLFGSISYRDASSRIESIMTEIKDTALNCITNGNYRDAVNIYTTMNLYGTMRANADEVSQAMYAKGEQLVLAGDYANAGLVFEALSNTGYLDSADWFCYAEAMELYAGGHYYDAYKMLSVLSFRDSAEMAQKCAQIPPASRILYLNGGYYSSSMNIIVYGAPASYSSFSFVKLYSEDGTLVGSAFVRAGESATFEVSSGSYMIKAAFGETWYGELDAFGDEGEYSVMQFDGTNDYTYFEDYYVYTVQLRVSSGGNLPSEGTNRDDF